METTILASSGGGFHMKISRLRTLKIWTVSLVVCGCGNAVLTQTASAASYYINCSATSNGNGTSAEPWNSLASPDSTTFSPGDTIYLNRGTTCYGAFAPLGSGSSSASITVTAYGSGAVPIIDGQANNAVMALSNQSYWTIENLKLLHGTYYGLYIYGSSSITGLNIVDVEATDASHTSTAEGDSGEIVLLAEGANSATISNTTINGAYAHDSTVSRGIFVQAGNYLSATGAKGSNITIENSTVSNVYGDGLLLEDATNSLITKNTVSKSGECSSCSGPTPDGIWTWNSSNVVMSWNESYSNNSWGADGGGFDIDTWNTNITVEYNYAHDNKGYCISDFGQGTTPTVNSVIRYNLCVNNDAMSTSQALGDIYLYTWNGGTLDGVQVYNNTSYFDSRVSGASVFLDAAAFSGSGTNFFENNLIYASGGYIVVTASAPITLSNNLYYTPSGELLWWGWGGTWYSTFASWHTGSDQDAYSINANPLLSSPGYDGTTWPTNQYTPGSSSPAVNAGANVCSGISGCSMGSYDFEGNPNEVSGHYEIGAVKYQ
jgi:parallel beta-helix repeat protein